MTHHDHPEELLAAYADGALDDRERAVVESHLSTCARCREESALAMNAVSTLRALPEEPVPFGVMNPVTAEIGHRMSRTAGRPLSRRVLWAAGGAIAAAFVAVVAVSILPSVGGSTGANDAAAPAAEAASSPTTARSAVSGGGAMAPVSLERTSTNYDDQALAALAVQTADSTAKGELAGAGESVLDSSATERASSCLAKGADVQPQDRLLRLIQARYQGEPALIGVFLTGPAPGQPANSVLVWVVRSDGCGFLSFTSKKL